MVGKIIKSSIGQQEGVRCLGIQVERYFLLPLFGKCFSCCWWSLYAPITAVHPYMGLNILLLCFAVVLTGGMGNLRGLFCLLYIGHVNFYYRSFWPAGSEIVVLLLWLLYFSLDQ